MNHPTTFLFTSFGPDFTADSISGFGYANQRIVRGVRVDTFSSLLKQDIGFFDSHTSGELASRLNSDCGEMAGDLVSRFMTDSVCSYFSLGNVGKTMLINKSCFRY